MKEKQPKNNYLHPYDAANHDEPIHVSDPDKITSRAGDQLYILKNGRYVSATINPYTGFIET